MSITVKTDHVYGGCYNASDLNRVGNAVLSVNTALSNAGYEITVTAKTDWTVADIPTESQMATYLANISTIRSVEICPSTSPASPTTMQFLTYQTANDIERILLDVFTLIDTFLAWSDVDTEDMTWSQLDAKNLDWGNYFTGGNT